MNLIFGTLLLAWILAWCVYCAVDIWQECRFQTAEAEHEELVAELWGNDE